MRAFLSLALALAIAVCAAGVRGQEAPTVASPLDADEAALLGLIHAAIRTRPALEGPVRWSVGASQQEQASHGRVSLDASALLLRAENGAELFAAADSVMVFDPVPTPGSLLRRTIRTPIADYAALVRDETTLSALFIPRILRRVSGAADLELLPRAPWWMVERIVVRVNTASHPGQLERALTMDGLGGHFRINLSELSATRRPMPLSAPPHPGARTLEF